VWRRRGREKNKCQARIDFCCGSGADGYNSAAKKHRDFYGIASLKAEGFECWMMSERFKGQWLNEKEEEER
jgi:hypothetical protein